MGTGPLDGPARDLPELSLLSGHPGILRIRRDQDLRGRDQQTGPLLQAPRAPDLLVGGLEGRTDRPAHRRLLEIPLQHLRYLSLQSDGDPDPRVVQAPADLWRVRRHGRNLPGTPTRCLRQPAGGPPRHGGRLHDLPKGGGTGRIASAGRHHLEDQGTGRCHLETPAVEQGTGGILQGVRQLCRQGLSHRPGHRRRILCLHEARRPEGTGNSVNRTHTHTPNETLLEKTNKLCKCRECNANTQKYACANHAMGR
mmetsp:Transcript_8291/g.17246  ORF Transcript_8291/g.17246 Transcript_8291/m.17246 type:complete len:254 (+) Transcript_8291:636-1397(+)